jgi:hypothetical protein
MDVSTAVTEWIKEQNFSWVCRHERLLPPQAETQAVIRVRGLHCQKRSPHLHQPKVDHGGLRLQPANQKSRLILQRLLGVRSTLPAPDEATMLAPSFSRAETKLSPTYTKNTRLMTDNWIVPTCASHILDAVKRDW